jgi:flagellar biosynthetic protein FliO
MKLPAVLTAILACPIQLCAQDSLKTIADPPEINYNPGIAGILFKLFISLVVIIGLIYLTVFLLKKFNNRALPGGNQIIKIIGRTYLTPKQSLYIVKLASTYAVLGVSDNSVNLIKELSAEEVGSFEQSPDKQKTFQNVLKSVLKR